MTTENAILIFRTPQVTRPGSQSCNRAVNKAEEALLLEWCSHPSKRR